MKRYISLVVLLLLFSCKAKAVLAEGKANETASAEKIIARHYNNKIDFSTLYIKSNVKYQDDKQALSVTAEIRIKKDEKILVSVRFLGFTVAKALITPTSVLYYEKSGRNYFEGNYAGISQWLGTDLDFNKVQNMLIGRALDDLTTSKYNVSIEDNLYKLENISDKKTKKLFYFEGENFLVKKQQISQPSEQRSLEILFPDFKKYDTMILPTNMQIDANQKDKKTEIDIEYNTINFNEELSFPYSVPEGYERIYIKN